MCDRPLLPSIMNQPSIYVKGLILVVIPLICQAIFLAALVKIRLDQAHALERRLNGEDVLTEASDLSALVAEAHSALRGYLITADPALAAQYREFQERTTAKLEVLAALVADNPPQHDRIKNVEARIA